VREVVANRSGKAARKSLQAVLRRIQQPARICLITFQSTAEVIFESDSLSATADAIGHVDAVLASMSPGNGTDVARALIVAREYIEPSQGSGWPYRYHRRDCLGWTRRGAAVRLAERIGIVDILLIDPTTRGKSVAEAISREFADGEITGVYSSVTLHAGMEEAEQAHAQRTEIYRDGARQGTRSASCNHSQIPTKERCCRFTVAIHGAPQPGVWYDLFVYLHLQRVD